MIQKGHIYHYYTAVVSCPTPKKEGLYSDYDIVVAIPLGQAFERSLRMRTVVRWSHANTATFQLEVQQMILVVNQNILAEGRPASSAMLT